MARRTKKTDAANATSAPTSDAADKQPQAANPTADDTDEETPESDITPPDIWSKTQDTISTKLLPLISQQEELFSLLLLAKGDAVNDSSKVQLVDVCQQLFRFLEYLAELQDRLKSNHKKKEGSDATSEEDHKNQKESLPCSLSGLHSLYTGMETPQHEATDNTPGSSNLVDIETIWGQVDLQNNALLPRLRKLIKKLAKSSPQDAGGGEVASNEIRLLDMSAMESNDENSDDASGSEENDDGDSVDEGSAASNLDEEEGDQSHESDEEDELDDDARRIRERMKKAMADMGESGDDFSEDEEDEVTSKSEQLKAITAKAKEMEESIIDPTRDEMRDGFFDLHEMEAFADEEEEYLPDEAYGAETDDQEGFDDSDGEVNGKKKKKNKKKVLPHIRDRLGESDSDSDENSEDEDGDDELTKRFKPNTVRRKKYRADDEVEALYELYNDKQDDEYDGSDVEEESAVENMTAVDIFGKPDEKLIQSYKSKHPAGTAKSLDKGGEDFDETDSWDDHGFGEDGADWKDDGDEDDGVGPEESEEEEEPDDDEEASDGNRPDKLSSHALQSKKLEQYTLRIEEEMMAEKPWKMRGETRGTDRPADSLLDSTPEFEVAFKPPPIITAEHTASIEEMIKKRIIEEDWDDVVPRELPDIGLHKRGGGEPPEVSQEKSKLGLGELYEREYLKKTTGFDRDAHEKETEEGAAEEEMKKLFANLCSKLDALSNYHFAPRPVADEADINKQDVPAIAMEEVLPLHVSTSRGIAPEEVYAGGKGRASVLKGESELDQAERNRIRNAKKSARRKVRKQKLADEKLISKLQPGLGLNNPYEKRKLREELQMARASGKVVVASESKALQDEGAAGKEYQTSTKFFQKMQQNVESMIRGDVDDGGRSKKRRKGLDGGQVSSAYKL
eukprot:CCRYP_011121-RB/>CCRYP_011121-RB protein AED:0.17 eAED:0.17 QI:182/1/1/1/1/1/3/44/904